MENWHFVFLIYLVPTSFGKIYKNEGLASVIYIYACPMDSNIVTYLHAVKFLMNMIYVKAPHKIQCS